MPRSPSEHPTELELAILKILWQQSPRTVEEVREALAAAGRDLTHSSVITMLNIMVRKKYLRRKKAGRAFQFEPVVEEQRVSRRLLSDIVNRVFDGSASALMLELLETGDVDAKELDAMRRLVASKSKTRNS